MLVPPSKGFALSVNTHNVALDALTEWIEGCITFVDSTLSRSDILDVLLEENIYVNQDFAKMRVDDAWAELNRRKKCLGEHCTFAVHGARVNRTQPWTEAPAYAFCLLLSLQVSYRPAFTEIFGRDYMEQGILFERLTAAAMQFTGWKTHSTGWSKVAANSIRDKVEALAAHLGEPSRPGAIESWTDAFAKDGGLDVVCHFPFEDGWPGRPLLYVQCASGENWKEKRPTPNLALWTKLLDLATAPTRGIAIPFVLLADDFRKAANCDFLSLLLDRHRLSAPSPTAEKGWLSNELAKDLNKWTKGRLPALYSQTSGMPSFA